MVEWKIRESRGSNEASKPSGWLLLVFGISLLYFYSSLPFQSFFKNICSHMLSP